MTNVMSVSESGLQSVINKIAANNIDVEIRQDNLMDVCSYAVIREKVTRSVIGFLFRTDNENIIRLNKEYANLL